ncbi:tetratricopeptide repeat protein [Bosea eneae]|uniref:Tetratricopeptide repeat protein n=1 Tax=Bosea eneae TaxID=151454 RepID=A0ABW0ILT3_9HYPH
MTAISSSAASPAIAAVRRAIQALNAGRCDEAEIEALSALAMRPQEPSALNVLGCVALSRNKPNEAIGFFERVRSTQSKEPLLHFNLGEAHRRAGALETALRHFRKAARLRPDFAEAHGQMGEMLRALGHSSEAAHAYRTALALNPNLPHCLNGLGLLLLHCGEFYAAAACFGSALQSTPAHMSDARAGLCANLGKAWIDAGEVPKGLAALTDAIACAPGEARFWHLLAISLLNVNAVPEGERFRTVLIELLKREDIDPRLVATAGVVALKHDLRVEALCARLLANPQAADDIIAQSATVIEALRCDALFLALLTATPIPDVGLELVLTRIRRDLLMAESEGTKEACGKKLDFICALARQCFLNEYVYWTDPHEETALAALRACCEPRGFVGGEVGWQRVAVLACYMGLHRTHAGLLNFDGAPEPLQALVCEQIAEPAREHEFAASVASLKPIRDTVSLAVQAQYEESPYPRWTRCQIGAPRPLQDVISSALPHVQPNELPRTDRPQILIAGCGTGVQTMKVIQTYANASVLAVDISRSSLAYGMRKLADLGIDSVRHLHADILDLFDLDERFDLIECFGVLHHMRDPETGLRILASLLAPNGLMFLGLYSELARSSVVAGRHFVAEQGLPAEPAGVRAGRRAIIIQAARPELGMLISPASDFWTLSECRDMIFHVEEHRFTLIEIGSMLQSCGLEFLGLELANPLDRARFEADHADKADIRSPAAWHDFENHYPNTFGDTYRIWARRADNAHNLSPRASCSEVP